MSITTDYELNRRFKHSTHLFISEAVMSGVNLNKCVRFYAFFCNPLTINLNIFAKVRNEVNWISVNKINISLCLLFNLLFCPWQNAKRLNNIIKSSPMKANNQKVKLVNFFLRFS